MLRITNETLTFDDVLLRPGFSSVLPADVSIRSRVSRGIAVNVPLMSAAMDTVTEARLAIGIAQEGGIGIVHKNMSVDAQADEVRTVKKYETGIIRDPITIDANASVQDLIDLTTKHQISGVPVIQADELAGIVTHRDIRFETRMDLRVSDVMTPKEKLVTTSEESSFETILELLQRHRIEKILLTNGNGQLSGMVTVKDIQKSQDFPNACKDDAGQLRVGASVGTSSETDERVAKLVEAGADLIVVDTAHGHSQNVIDRIRWIKQSFADLDVVGGNVATAEGARALVDAGADAVKVGIGPGSICTTRMVTGVGVPQVTAIDDVASEVQADDVPVIADGGIRYSGDIAKAIAAGADCVMIGSLLAGTDEAPGDIELYQGRTYKSYRGMGSLGAMAEHRGSRNRYALSDDANVNKLVPEGVEGRVPYRGPLRAVVQQMTGGLRSAMGYTGCDSIQALRTKSQFSAITSASQTESHVHDVDIVKEAPNYPG